MINLGKFEILGINVWAGDYAYLLQEIAKAAAKKKSLLISPVTSQTIMSVYNNDNLIKINKFNYLPPDSQWVRFALNFLYRLNLKQRVYGPELMLRVCQLSSEKKYPIYLYGTTNRILHKLKANLLRLYPKVNIQGMYAPRFGVLSEIELEQHINNIIINDPVVIFIGLGSPRRELFGYKILEHLNSKNKAAIIIPIGAAFDFISGVKSQAPAWVGDLGFEWLYRLLKEPKRLWRRYLISGPLFIILIIVKKFKIFRPPSG